MFLNKEKFEELYDIKNKRVNLISLDKMCIIGIEKYTFKNLYHLVLLDLSNNKISYLHKNIFKDLVNIAEILLNNNLLTHLHKDIFINLERFEDIHLENNKLTKINLNIGLQKVKYFYNQCIYVDKQIINFKNIHKHKIILYNSMKRYVNNRFDMIKIKKNISYYYF
jgi:Leucine-rich repeat (LRR) protein